MVPTQDIAQYTSDLQNRGFLPDSTHNFQDFRGGQSGTGDEQTLIIWGVPSDMQMSAFTIVDLIIISHVPSLR